MIHCYRVSVKKQMDNLTLTSQTLPSFFLTGGAARDIPEISITHLNWMNGEDSESLLIGTKTPSGCFIELWGLVDKATPIHSHFKHLFQQPNKTEVFKTVVSSVANQMIFNLKSNLKRLIFLFINRFGHIRSTIVTQIALSIYAHQNFNMEHLHTYSFQWQIIRFTVYTETP